ncbi:hypothetical protein BLOT_015171 [Blomia tropicalis]|nr:hypothetical protein BLOT_015171 [Blomia tropicalis]
MMLTKIDDHHFCLHFDVTVLSHGKLPCYNVMNVEFNLSMDDGFDGNITLSYGIIIIIEMSSGSRLVIIRIDKPNNP